MYHPAAEEGPEDEHEFVELHNRGEAEVPLDGWRLTGDVRFTFPAGAKLAPGGYVVVARRRARLLAVPGHLPTAGPVLGDYEGALPNGKRGRVELVDGTGAVHDRVVYSAERPWPLGADALGAGDEWLTEDRRSKRPHVGRSLERTALDLPGDAVEAWEASPLDAPTPGRPTALSMGPRAVVVSATATSRAGAAGPIGAGAPVVVRAALSGRGEATALAVEYVREAAGRPPEPARTVAMTRAPGAGAPTWEAELPAAPENTVVRYRILGQRGGGPAEPLSPRPSDPDRHHLYAVSPPLAGRTRAYQIHVAPSAWGELWTNAEPGFVKGCGLGENTTCKACAVNERWNATVPAVFVDHEGRAHDVRVRYQGGKFARLSGRKLARWPHPTPTAPGGTPPALGWKVKFPRHARFDGQRAIRLNKRVGACTGLPDLVTARVFEAAGVPAFSMRYARLYVNGGYYLYALEQEPVDEDFLERRFPEEPLGDLYDANSIRWDQGPYGWGDFRILQPFCGYTKEQRYAHTYERQTLAWKGNADLVALLEGLHAARGAGGAALRAFLERHFDVPQVLRYLAVVNWASAWDDDYHNYALHRRADGKWAVLATDLNQLATGLVWDAATGKGVYGVATASFHLGREGEPTNWKGRFSYLKDAFFRAFPTEYDALLETLATEVFRPAIVEKHLDEALGSFDAAEARAALSAGATWGDLPCDDPGPEAARIRAFVRERHRVLLERLGP
jgi:hypothetical protein